MVDFDEENRKGMASKAIEERGGQQQQKTEVEVEEGELPEEGEIMDDEEEQQQQQQKGQEKSSEATPNPQISSGGGGRSGKESSRSGGGGSSSWRRCGLFITDMGIFCKLIGEIWDSCILAFGGGGHFGGGKHFTPRGGGGRYRDYDSRATVTPVRAPRNNSTKNHLFVNNVEF